MTKEELEFERQKWLAEINHQTAIRESEINREHAIRAHDRSKEEENDYLKAALDTSALAIRSLILVNGAAVIALLAFLGAVEASAGAAEFNSTYLVWPILWFALGVGSGATTAVLAYVVNLLDHGISCQVKLKWEHPYVERTDGAKRDQTIRTVVFWIALLSALSSLVMFFVGIFSVTDAIMQSGI